MVVNGFSGAVGNTPLIELRELSRLLGRRVLGKAEFLNPGGSVKDRAARAIVDDAEARGALQPGGTIVEGTAGNTGIALALVANERSYKSVIVVPDDQSSEKIALLRAYGSDVRVVPAAPFTNPENYYHVARGIAESMPGAFWANQFENTANRRAHELTTGPEIWEQTRGRIDAFVAAAGTGGTIAGVATALKARAPGILTVLCDPMGSALYNYVNHGELKPEGDSDLEGIGIKRRTSKALRWIGRFARQTRRRSRWRIGCSNTRASSSAARAGSTPWARRRSRGNFQPARRSSRSSATAPAVIFRACSTTTGCARITSRRG
jgi:cysteine synthase A